MRIEELYDIFLLSGKITTDTRKCTAGSIFFALKGENFDGNKFAAKALELGCSYAVVDNPALQGLPHMIYVENTLETLRRLSRMHRRAMAIPVIAITGTNGKTTTKELMAKALSCRYSVLATEGNLNNGIGVPLTLLKISRSNTLAIIEMGASHIGDIKELVEIAEPDFGLITNIGRAHLQGFGSYQGVITTKCELYDFIRNRGGKVFVRHEDAVLNSKCQGIEKIEYGYDTSLFVNGSIKECSPFLSVNISTSKAESETISTGLIGRYNLDNILAAVAVATYFGVPLKSSAAAISAYVPTNSRSQFIKGLRNDIVLDAYNANPSSMKASIDNFREIKTGSKMLILGDMLELGNDSYAEHKKVVDTLQQYGFNDVLLVGREFSAVAGKYLSFENTDTLIQYLTTRKPSGFTILIKGSRGIKLEQCVSLL